MKQNKISILTTRPLTRETMLKAQAASIEIDTASFIQTNNIIDKTTALQIKQHGLTDASVVFTSMNAAEAVIDCLKMFGIVPDWTIYTMGGTTHTIIKSFFGESEIFSDANNATQLAEKIIENEEDKVVFFCGNQRRDELPKQLNEAAIKVAEIVVYETLETAVNITKNYNGILFYSPSAVRSFFSVNKVDANTVLFAIGTTTAVELRKFSPNKILLGDQPNKELLAEKAIEYLSQ